MMTENTMFRTPTEWLCDRLMNGQLSIPPIANFVLTVMSFGGAVAVVINTWGHGA